MRTLASSVICIIFLSGIVYAQPPTLEIPSEIDAKGDYVAFSPTSNATVITYIGMSGIDPFPSEMLKDQKAFILSIRGLKEGRYKFVAIAIKANEFTRKDFYVKVGNGIIPPVPPTPEPPTPKPPEPLPPKPDPKLDDAPVQTTGLHVVIIYETGQRVNQEQFNIMYGATVRGYLDTNCDRVNNQPQWRILDKDSRALTEPWKDVLTRKRTNVPWIIVMSGKKYVYEGELSFSQEEFTKLLDKYKPKARTDYCPNCPAPYTFQQTPLK